MNVVFLQGGGEGAHDEDAELAASLQRHLGDGFRVQFPRLPREDEPDEARWLPVIAEAVVGASVLVGHSLGAYLLARHLGEARPPGIDVVCLIAPPFPGGDPDWTFDGFALPDDFGSAFPPATFLYASEDDEVVPFAHRDLYAAAIPGAVTRTTTGGHQLRNDLRRVAADITATVNVH